MRDFLRINATLETIVDFGEHQIFEGVTTYPAILTMKAGAPAENHELQFWNINELPKDNFGEAFDGAKLAYPQLALGKRPWELEDFNLRILRDKIKNDRETLRQAIGSPLYGIKTGLNEAFVISTATKEMLCRSDPARPNLATVFGRKGP